MTAESAQATEHRFHCGGVPVVARGPPRTGAALILAHGAGQGMDSPFMSFFHEGLARLGYLSVKFNFHYMEAGRRVPDPQPKLRALYLEVIDAVCREFSPEYLVIGGKSMGGRVASYIAGDRPSVGGLVFLGYPLHPPGKPDRLRDAHLYTLDRPMLFVSGTRDTLARKELLEEVVAKIGPRAALSWMEHGDHSFKAGKKIPDRLPGALREIDRWMNNLRRPPRPKPGGAPSRGSS